MLLSSLKFFSVEMPNCGDLVTIDVFVSSNLLGGFESQRQLMKMLEKGDFSSFFILNQS